MNFATLQEVVWRTLGIHESAAKYDYRTQEIKDALNLALFEIADVAPYLTLLTEHFTLSVTNGTAVYALDEYVTRILEFWTEDDQAHRIAQLAVKRTTRNGMRNTNLVYGSLGPWNLTREPALQTALMSGAAASATGVSVAEGGTSLTFGASITLTTAINGLSIRFDGEDEDYLITYVGAQSATIDKAYKGRLSGLGTTGVGSGKTNAAWEIRPGPIEQIKFLPTPTASATVKYRGVVRPRRMILDTDVPRLNKMYHDILWKRALSYVNLTNDEGERASAYLQLAEKRVQELKDQDRAEDSDNDEAPFIAALEERTPRNFMPPGVSFRSDGF